MKYLNLLLVYEPAGAIQQEETYFFQTSDLVGVANVIVIASEDTPVLETLSILRSYAREKMPAIRCYFFIEEFSLSQHKKGAKFETSSDIEKHFNLFPAEGVIQVSHVVLTEWPRSSAN